VLFAIPRTAGWVAQWEEMLPNRNTKSPAPGKLTGPQQRDYCGRATSARSRMNLVI